jgi:hypothetical protein
MANRAHSSSKPDVHSQFIWPPRNANIRRLKQGEIERLEETLGEEADREYLVFWVSQSIANHVKLSTSRPPTARQCRDGLRRLAGQGRRWLQQIDACPGTDLLGPGAHVAEVTTKVVELCQQAEAVAKAVGGSIKRGHPKTSVPLEAFLGNMIGIAKRAGVPPSTPNRAKGARPWATPFFEFVTTALSIARDVIKTSALADHEKKAALAKLTISDKALAKIIERRRGRIRNYRPSPHGLIEWKQ